MGLDNIPSTYACKNQGTAVMIPLLDKDSKPVIDENGLPEVGLSCEKTQEAGGCPWKTVLGDKDGQALGIFGTDCWYRGKYGVWLLEQVGLESHVLYGEGTEVGAGYLSESDLMSVYNGIEALFTEDDGTRITKYIINDNGADRDIGADLWYLAEWCRFTAKYCGGAESWY